VAPSLSDHVYAAVCTPAQFVETTIVALISFEDVAGRSADEAAAVM